MSSDREQPQGSAIELASSELTRTALDKAFQYRGDVTLTLFSGEKVEGYIFDRSCEESRLEDCRVRLFLKDSDEKRAISYSDIRRVEFSGRDTAEGKSFERWMQNYREKKARGEKNISLEPDPLD
jgi:hypothetical protein